MRAAGLGQALRTMRRIYFPPAPVQPPYGQSEMVAMLHLV